MPESGEVLFRLSDNIIEVTGTINAATGSYINNADVTLTLVDADSGQEIAGQTWPLILSYVTGSNGDYRGTINDDISVSEQQEVVAKVTVDGGAGLRRHWGKKCVVVTSS